MTAFSLRLTNGANAVSQLHGDTANAHLARRRPARDPRASPTASTPRPGSASRCATCSSATPTPTSTPWTTSPRERRFWERLGPDPDARSCGRPTSARSWSSRSSPAAGCATSSPATARRPRRSRSSRRSSTRRSSPSASPAASRPTSAPRCCSRDMDRLARLLWDDGPAASRSSSPARPTRPTGPASGSSRTSSRRSRSPKLRGRVFILEDYDMRIARFLVQGVDVWLNNPRRPLEASGTRGMKAAANGVVNLSRPRRLVGRGLDRRQRLGHRRPRDEPRRGRPGLGRRAGPLPDPRAGDRARATTTATRTACRAAGSSSMRESIASTIWRFSTTRMLHEYVEQLYLPGGRRRAPTRRDRAATPRHVPARAAGTEDV